jgi:transposase
MAAELISEAAWMLTQERLVEIHVLETQGLSIRAIGRKFGVSRNTVRRYLRDRCLKPQYPCPEVKPTKLDPFKGYMLRSIDAAKPHLIPATVMLVEIKAQDYEGGGGGYPDFTDSLIE